MNKKIYTFFVLVFAFCGSLFADCESDKQSSLNYLDLIATNIYFISVNNHEIYSSAGYINGTSSELASRTEAIAIQSRSRSINEDCVYALADIGNVRAFVQNIDCGTNGTCSVDLGPLVEICSNIYDVVVAEKNFIQDISDNTDLLRLTLDDIFNRFVKVSYIDYYGGYVNVFDSRLLNAVSNFNNDVSSSFDTLTNQVASLNSTLSYFYGEWSGVILDFYQYISDIYCVMSSMSNDIRSIAVQCLNYLEYLRYLELISQDISYLATNEYFNVNVLNLTNFLASRSSYISYGASSFHRMSNQFRVTSQSGVTPYNSVNTLLRANLQESVQGGFVNLFYGLSSLNNYFNWLMHYLGTNKTDYSEITIGLANLSNTLNRVDGYVLGDFSNQFYHVFECIDTLVSNSLDKVDYTTNLVEITQQLYTNNNHLASIDSKLDVLDYIKVLSNIPLSDFSGDSYYDYLTNLYLNGVSSSAPSTNWFERIEILLASMVFGDSASSSISNEVEFSNFSEETIENAFNDYTFQSELNSGIGLVENTGDNFLTILRGFHDSLSSVTQPQSIAIGLGGLDGQDTTTYEDVMHGHFQVSFNSGEVDSFTLIVRSMTTIIWILITMMFVYFSARWLLSKVLFFYRLMRTLITSLFLK